ncbi:hypothetical protein CLU79DRAFT_678413, partial [Phycomyces nitens]
SSAVHDIPKLSWKRFWHQAIPHHCRTVWWKALWQCVPTRSRLHRILPSVVHSPLWQLCLAQDESMGHFFFSYPRKLVAWEATLSQHVLFLSLAYAQQLLLNGIFPPP